MNITILTNLSVDSPDLCGACSFAPPVHTTHWTHCQLFNHPLLDPHGAPVRCAPCRRSEKAAESLPKWTPVSSGVFPHCGKTNGFWNTVPVIIAIANRHVEGGPLEVVGAFYEKVDLEHKERILHRFRTDEGISYDNVEYWMPLPEPPKP